MSISQISVTYGNSTVQGTYFNLANSSGAWLGTWLLGITPTGTAYGWHYGAGLRYSGFIYANGQLETVNLPDAYGTGGDKAGNIYRYYYQGFVQGVPQSHGFIRSKNGDTRSRPEACGPT